jgi:glycosyltransferase involved in cell wall biosynthesis
MPKSSPEPEIEAAEPIRAAAADAATGKAAGKFPPGRPLKILQVSHDLRAGGLQRVVIDLAHGLRRLGHDAHICSLRGPGPLEAEIRGRGIPLSIMPWPERGADRRMFAKVFRLLRQHRYDVVHTHNTQAFLDGGLAALLGRVPVRIHTDHARSFPDKLRYMILERIMSHAYDKVVGVSAHTAENLRRYEGISAKRLAVIQNGIDGAWYRAERDGSDAARMRRDAGLEGFRRVFGLGVRLEEQKGIRYLLEALPLVLAEHPHTGVAIAGNGSLEHDLSARARDLGVADHVRFLGPYPQLTAFYPLIDGFVLPSLWEGLPLCLLEAMSLGLPIIATRVGGVPDVLEDGRTAKLVPPMDPISLARAMISCLDDEAAAEDMGREARRVFDAKYDSAVMVARYLDLYQGGSAPGAA